MLLHLSDIDDDQYMRVVDRRQRCDSRSCVCRTRRRGGDELLIADGKSTSALAGVMGGLHTSITFDTVYIALESAVFEPGSVRKTSYKHKLSTDSSYRFERHLSGEYAASISDRAASLILEIAGGKLCGKAYVEIAPALQKFGYRKLLI